MVAIAIDDQPGEIVSFAVDQPRGAGAVVEPERPAKGDGSIDPRSPEGGVERHVGFKGVEPDAEPARGIPNPAGDKPPLVRGQIDDIAVSGGAFDAVDGGVEHPGMAPEERSRPLRLHQHRRRGKAGLVGGAGRRRWGRRGGPFIATPPLGGGVTPMALVFGIVPWARSRLPAGAAPAFRHARPASIDRGGHGGEEVRRSPHPPSRSSGRCGAPCCVRSAARSN